MSIGVELKRCRGAEVQRCRGAVVQRCRTVLCAGAGAGLEVLKSRGSRGLEV